MKCFIRNKTNGRIKNKTKQTNVQTKPTLQHTQKGEKRVYYIVSPADRRGRREVHSVTSRQKGEGRCIVSPADRRGRREVHRFHQQTEGGEGRCIVSPADRRGRREVHSVTSRQKGRREVHSVTNRRTGEKGGA